ncbi:MAG: Ig-like domain-containing protein [Eubacterium sp.]|nr:Ig-like domain-containing protein [Eubacterium sp.]
MRKSAKRFLSMILALTMFCSCMVVTNISTVFAADTVTYTWDFTDSEYYSATINANTSVISDQKETTAIFTAIGKLSYQDSVISGTQVAKTELSATSNNSYSSSSDYNAVSIAVPSGSSAVLNIQLASGSAGKTFYINDGSGNTVKTVTCSTRNIIYDSGNISLSCGTTYYLNTSEYKAYIGKVTLAVTSSTDPSVSISAADTTIAPAGTTTVTATTQNAGSATVSYTSSDTSIATVDAEGTVTGIAKGIATITATITVSDKDYTDSVDIEVKNDGEASIVTSTGTISLLDSALNITTDKTAVTADTVISDYFTVVGDGVVGRVNSNSVFYALELLQNAANSIQFTTSKAFDVTVSCASTGSSNASLINIKDSNGPVTIMQAALTSGNTTNFTVTLPAGTYDIYNPGSSRTTRVSSVTFAEASEVTTADTVVETIGDSTYVFFAVPESALANASFDVNVNGTLVTGSTGDTVYTGVTISGATYEGTDDTKTSDDTNAMDENYSPAALGIDSDYVVGYKIADTSTVYEASYYTLTYTAVEE